MLVAMFAVLYMRLEEQAAGRLFDAIARTAEDTLVIILTRLNSEDVFVGGGKVVARAGPELMKTWFLLRKTCTRTSYQP